MDRRAFLGSLSVLSAGMLLDPERALWVPGRRTYFDIVRPIVRDQAFYVELALADGRTMAFASPLSGMLSPGDGVYVSHPFMVPGNDDQGEYARVLSVTFR